MVRGCLQKWLKNKYYFSFFFSGWSSKSSVHPALAGTCLLRACLVRANLYLDLRQEPIFGRSAILFLDLRQEPIFGRSTILYPDLRQEPIFGRSTILYLDLRQEPIFGRSTIRVIWLWRIIVQSKELFFLFLSFWKKINYLFFHRRYASLLWELGFIEKIWARS